MSALDTLLAQAQTVLGKPYVYGADSPGRGFDCSGLTEYLYSIIGIRLPHNAAEQQAMTTPVKNPLPGDLVFFGQPAYHVGLYIGGGKMISAPHTGAVVHVTDVGTPTGYGRVAGAGVATAGLSDAAAAGGTQLAGLTFNADSFFGKAQGFTMQLLAAGLALGLVAAGAWLIASPGGKKFLGNTGIGGT